MNGHLIVAATCFAVLSSWSCSSRRPFLVSESTPRNFARILGVDFKYEEKKQVFSLDSAEEAKLAVRAVLDSLDAFFASGWSYYDCRIEVRVGEVLFFDLSGIHRMLFQGDRENAPFPISHYTVRIGESNLAYLVEVLRSLPNIAVIFGDWTTPEKLQITNHNEIQRNLGGWPARDKVATVFLRRRL